jgi:hypothetical protein
MLLRFLLGPLSASRFRNSQPAAVPDPGVSDPEGGNEQIPAEEDSGSGEKFITIVVPTSLFGVFVIVILALCCTKRTAIGKPEDSPADPLQQWSAGVIAYTGTESLSQFALAAESAGGDCRIDL